MFIPLKNIYILGNMRPYVDIFMTFMTLWLLLTYQIIDFIWVSMFMFFHCLYQHNSFELSIILSNKNILSRIRALMSTFFMIYIIPNTENMNDLMSCFNILKYSFYVNVHFHIFLHSFFKQNAFDLSISIKHIHFD